MSRIGVIGSGYVGVVTGACFARLGHTVTCMDIDAARVAALHAGQVPFYEADLRELVRTGLATGRLCFTEWYNEAAREADFLFIAVNTPSAHDGAADLQPLRGALQGIVAAIDGGRPPVIVFKSTVPVGTTDSVAAQLSRFFEGAAPVVSNPEFLREGLGVTDFFAPDRVVVGGADAAAVEAVAALYRFAGCPVLCTDARSAEMIKYAANAFLATKISFINEIAAVAAAVGADIARVADGIGLDRRIGSAHLRPGLGFGGSCLPKDLRALTHLASSQGIRPHLLDAVLQVNASQPRHLMAKLREALGGLDRRCVALLGIAFKAGTDDVREAPSLELIQLLQSEGALVRVYDPAVACRVAGVASDVVIATDPYEAARGADAVVLVTEWEECVRLDFLRLSAEMRGRAVADGRHAWDTRAVQAAGLRDIGRAGGPGQGSHLVTVGTANGAGRAGAGREHVARMSGTVHVAPQHEGTPPLPRPDGLHRNGNRSPSI